MKYVKELRDASTKKLMWGIKAARRSLKATANREVVYVYDAIRGGCINGRFV